MTSVRELAVGSNSNRCLVGPFQPRRSYPTANSTCPLGIIAAGSIVAADQSGGNRGTGRPGARAAGRRRRRIERRIAGGADLEHAAIGEQNGRAESPPLSETATGTLPASTQVIVVGSIRWACCGLPKMSYDKMLPSASLVQVSSSLPSL